MDAIAGDNTIKYSQNHQDWNPQAENTQPHILHEIKLGDWTEP